MVLYTKVFEVFDGSIECGSSVDAINGMADYFNEFGKSVVTTICKKATVAFLDAKISGASKVDALKAAATTYTDYIADYPALLLGPAHEEHHLVKNLFAHV